MTIILKCSLTPGTGVVKIEKDDLLLIVILMDTPTMTAINLVQGLVKRKHLAAVNEQCSQWTVYPDAKAVALASHDLAIEVAV